jgi:hypothetical protein
MSLSWEVANALRKGFEKNRKIQIVSFQHCKVDPVAFPAFKTVTNTRF